VEKGYENVYGVVTERGGTGPVRKMNSQLFYWLAGRLHRRPNHQER